MKYATIFFVLAALLVVVSALPRRDPPRLPRPTGGNPNFGSYGSFNPRGRRSPVQGKVVVDQPTDGRATVDANVQHKIYEGDNAKVTVYGNAKATENEPLRGRAGVRAEITFGDDD